jgi:hypothetical protein
MGDTLIAVGAVIVFDLCVLGIAWLYKSAQ